MYGIEIYEFCSCKRLQTASRTRCEARQHKTDGKKTTDIVHYTILRPFLLQKLQPQAWRDALSSECRKVKNLFQFFWCF